MDSANGWLVAAMWADVAGCGRCEWEDDSERQEFEPTPPARRAGVTIIYISAKTSILARFTLATTGHISYLICYGQATRD